MTTDREQLIRDRAHAIWEAEGRPDGREHDHWTQACREIDEAVAAPSPTAAAQAPKRGKAKASAPVASKPAAAEQAPAEVASPATRAPRGGKAKAAKAVDKVADAPATPAAPPATATPARGRRKKAD